MIERTNVPVKDQVRRVKEVFQKLDKDVQVECHSLRAESAS